MLKIRSSFSGFSVNDIKAAKQFYGEVLGFELEDKVGGTSLKLPGGASAWMYQSENHKPAAYTMLDFMVDNIDEAYDALSEKDVVFERYPDSHQDEKGIMRGKEHEMGPNIAWFKDPADNILAILED